MSARPAHGSFQRALASGLSIVTCEIASGDSANPEDVRRRARLVRGHVDAVNVPDNTAGVVHMSALATSVLLVEEGIDPILHVTCRDRNRLALQSDLLGASALGIHNVLCLTGDHMVHGDQPQAKPVFDLDSIQLIGLVDHLTTRGQYLSGRPIDPPPTLLAGTTENPFAPPHDFRPLRLQKKIEAGARFVQTQIIFNVERFRAFMARVCDLGLDRRAPILAGVAPLRSARAAIYMRDHVPGMEVPETLVKRMEGAGTERGRREEEGLEICIEIIEQVRDMPGVSGIHLMPIHWEEAVAEIVSRSGLAPASQRLAPKEASAAGAGRPAGLDHRETFSS